MGDSGYSCGPKYSLVREDQVHENEGRDQARTLLPPYCLLSDLKHDPHDPHVRTRLLGLVPINTQSCSINRTQFSLPPTKGKPQPHAVQQAPSVTATEPPRSSVTISGETCLATGTLTRTANCRRIPARAAQEGVSSRPIESCCSDADCKQP